MKSSSALSTTIIGTFGFRASAGGVALARAHPLSGLYRMNTSSKQPGSPILARFARAVAAAHMAPRLALKAKVGEVLAMMRRGATKQALHRLAERKLMQRIDFRQMAQQVVGNAWPDAKPQQQRALEEGLRSLLLERYAAALSSAANGDLQFEVKPVRHSNADDVTVKTLVHAVARPTVAIDFRMHSQGRGWKVYDVLVDGVSVTAPYRNTFAAEVRRSGIGGSIKVLDASVRKLATMRDTHRRAYA